MVIKSDAFLENVLAETLTSVIPLMSCPASLNINWWGNEKHITGNGHGAQRERAYLRDKRFPWAFNFHAKAHSGILLDFVKQC